MVEGELKRCVWVIKNEGNSGREKLNKSQSLLSYAKCLESYYTVESEIE